MLLNTCQLSDKINKQPRTIKENHQTKLYHTKDCYMESKLLDIFIFHWPFVIWLIITIIITISDKDNNGSKCLFTPNVNVWHKEVVVFGQCHVCFFLNLQWKLLNRLDIRAFHGDNTLKAICPPALNTKGSWISCCIFSFPHILSSSL